MKTIYQNDQVYQLLLINDSTLKKIDQIRIGELTIVELFDHSFVKLPRNFVTDFHSVPRCLQWILPAFNNKTNLAAAVHDLLYMRWEHYLKTCPEKIEIDGRIFADKAFLALMHQFSPTTKLENHVYYLAVRVFGYFNWKKFRKRHLLS